MKYLSKTLPMPLLKALPFLVAAGAGCGPAAIEISAQRVGAARVATAPLASDAADGATATNRLALALLAALDARPGAAAGNFAFAPASLEGSLNMVAVGAVGPTRAGMVSALGFDGLATGPLAASSALLRSLADTDSARTTLVAADKVWAQSGLTLEATYAQALAHMSQAVGRADFRADPELARATINEWAATQTKGMVKHLFPEGAIDGLTRLVTADTLLLDAPWKSPFDARLTAPKPFAAPGGEVQVPTMRQVGEFPYVTGELGAMVELPLDGERFALDVLVPGPGVELLGGEQLSAMLASLLSKDAKARPVAVELPRFSTRTALRLDDEFKRLGMTEAFSDRADFSGMVRGEALGLGGVLQQVAIQVNERGTRAGVASGAVVQHRMSNFHADEVHADRPFLYLVRDRRSGAFLVVGRVADPSKD